ncbi:MAG TPA: PilN domain-containing protein [Cellvibrio sp.]|nr:PilN domain-containing protein [Cellvibrio sp.]
MAKINLLPWREVYRKEKKEQFLMAVGGVFALSALVAYLWMVSVEADIDNQDARNRLLESEIAVLNKQVEEINDLKKKRDDLLVRIKIIQDLEGKRPLIVRYFDDFARAIPDGLYINAVNRKGENVAIEGVGESYNRVASLMRNLDISDWYASANLDSIVDVSKEEGEQASSFKMTVQTSVPGDENIAESADAKKAKTDGKSKAKASPDKKAGGA